MSPYRSNPEEVPKQKSNAPGVEPLTAGELAFWEAIYIANVVKDCSSEEKAGCADRAVARRRERFGVR